MSPPARRCREGEGEAAGLARAFNAMADALEARVAEAGRRVGGLVVCPALLTARSLEASLKSSVEHIHRLLAEDRLHFRDECLRQIADGVREVFWLSDVEDGRVLYVNRAYEALWGQSAESRDFLERTGLPSVAKPFTVEDLLAGVARALGPPPPWRSGEHGRE